MDCIRLAQKERYGAWQEGRNLHAKEDQKETPVAPKAV
jgi:hypothetical protein